MTYSPLPTCPPGEFQAQYDAPQPVHVPDPDPEHGAFDVCLHCRHPIVQHWDRREQWVTMTGGNHECYR